MISEKTLEAASELIAEVRRLRFIIEEVRKSDGTLVASAEEEWDLMQKSEPYAPIV